MAFLLRIISHIMRELLWFAGYGPQGNKKMNHLMLIIVHEGVWHVAWHGAWLLHGAC